MAEKAVLLWVIFVAICVRSFAEETEDLSGTDELKGNQFTTQGFNIVSEFYISFYSQLKLCEKILKLYTSYNLVSDAVEEKNVPAEVNDTVLEASNANATLNETGILGLNGTVSNTSQVENSTKTKLNDETVNSTSANSGLPKWFCKGRNNSQSNETLQQKVVIVNSEELLKLINATTDNETDSCAVVLFFTQYCPFCAKLAPLYNALGRVYNNLPILAIDAYKQHR